MLSKRPVSAGANLHITQAIDTFFSSFSWFLDSRSADGISVNILRTKTLYMSLSSYRTSGNEVGGWLHAFLFFFFSG